MMASACFEPAVPQTARRHEWEASMQTFGVVADVDALNRRKTVSRTAGGAPLSRLERAAGMQAFDVDADDDAMSRRRHCKKPLAVATRAEVQRRAAQYGDILAVQPRRHCEPRAAEPVSARGQGGLEVQAFDIDAQQRRCRPSSAQAKASESYDTPGQSRRKFFDGAVHAERYTRMLARPGAEPEPEEELAEPRHSALLELTEAELPLHVRRVLKALLPGKSDRTLQDLPMQVRERICAQVEFMVSDRLGRRRSTVATKPKRSIGNSSTSTAFSKDSPQRHDADEEVDSSCCGDFEVPHSHQVSEDMAFDPHHASDFEDSTDYMQDPCAATPQEAGQEEFEMPRAHRLSGRMPRLLPENEFEALHCAEDEELKQAMPLFRGLPLPTLLAGHPSSAQASAQAKHRRAALKAERARA
mmetsp:Transcript_103166/g.290254  ORF Transcript_103166/g.290254 Transcript_103166/m.290254 type:complete len:415 (+) Transcript_103166:108-1352(+)